jgi:hypothetical protein
MKTLVDLIKDSLKLDAPVAAIGNDLLQRAVNKMVEQRETAVMEKLSTCLGTFQGVVDAQVQVLRDLREKERKTKEILDKTTRAYLFFAETSNPFPMFKEIGRPDMGMDFAKGLGMPYPAEDSDVWVIPPDWKPAKKK